MTAPTLTLEIATPEGRFLMVAAELVEMPTTSGEIGVFPGHARLLTEIGVGELRVHHAGAVDCYTLAGGFAEIDGDSVRIIATFALGEVDEGGLEEALARARAALELAETLPADVVNADLAALQVEFAALVRRKKPRSHL